MIIAITAVKTTGIRMSHIAVTVCKIERTSNAISFAHPICLRKWQVAKMLEPSPCSTSSEGCSRDTDMRGGLCPSCDVTTVVYDPYSLLLCGRPLCSRSIIWTRNTIYIKTSVNICDVSIIVECHYICIIYLNWTRLPDLNLIPVAASGSSSSESESEGTVGISIFDL